MKFCVCTYQWWGSRAGEGPQACPGRAAAGSDPVLASAAIPNPCTRCWDPPPIPELLEPGSWWGRVPACSHPVPAPLLPGLSAVAVAQLKPSPPPNRCQKHLVPLLAKPSASIRGRGHSWLLLSQCRSPWSSTFLMASVPTFPWLSESLGYQRRKITLNRVPWQLQGPVWNHKMGTWTPSRGWGGAVGPGLALGHPWWWVMVALPCTLSLLVLETPLLWQS